MNYKNIYDSLIQKAIIRQIGKSKDILKKDIGYIENHHIVPEFFFKNRKRKGPPGWLDGDPNNKDNLVFLTAKEHLLSHLLLLKIYPNNDGLVTACVNMAGHTNKKISIRMYEKLRIAYAQIVSDRFKGIAKSQSHKDNLSKSLAGKLTPHMVGDKNPMHLPEVVKKVTAKRKGKLRVQKKDALIFEFENIDTTEIFKGTRQEFRKYSNLTPVDVGSLISGRQLTSKSWKLPTTAIRTESWNRDNSNYTIKEICSGKEYTGTRYEILALCAVSYYTIQALVSGKNKKSKGWILVKSNET